MLEQKKQFIMDWITERGTQFSDWHNIIWNFGETAFREYRSSKWYVEKLREEGFTVEEGSAGMPTAFCAVWKNGELANNRWICRI